MLKDLITKHRFLVADYPNLDPSAADRAMPERWGSLDNVRPVLVDTAALKYKYMRRPAHALRAVRDGAITLTPGVDYTSDLANGEFTILASPYLEAETTYAFVLEADSPADIDNFFRLVGSAGAEYDGVAFYIDDEDELAVFDSGGSLELTVYGKADIGGEQEAVMAVFIPDDPVVYPLKDTAARTKIGQTFTTGESGFYLTRIWLAAWAVGEPTGNLRIRIYKVGEWEDQIGTVSADEPANKMPGGASIPWLVRGAPSDISCDIDCVENGDMTLMTNAGDILADIRDNILEVDALLIPDSEIAALKAARAQVLAINLDRETSFDQLKQKLEAGQLFKILPQIDGTMVIRIYSAGEPAGTPHYRNDSGDDFQSFSMIRLFDRVRHTIKVTYDEDPSTGEWKSYSENSNIARCLYRSGELLEIPTYLKEAAGAQWLALVYKAMYEYPPVQVDIAIGCGDSLEQIPSDKVKLTRTRAAYANGVLQAVLFRIEKAKKGYAPKARVEISAILDPQTRTEA